MPQNQELSELVADVKEQISYLQELGVESLKVELPEVRPAVSVSRPAASVTATAAERKTVSGDSELRPPAHPVGASPVAKPMATGPQAGARLAALPSLSKRKPVIPVEPLQGTEGMAENPGQSAKDNGPAAEPGESLFGDIGPTLERSSDTIESIRAEIGDCTRCQLCSLGRSQIVHSTGNFNADLMFVGEAPGADEDEQGLPFVGRAGQLLTKIIESIGMKREDVFIGNINRCRPPGNRAPEPDETAACRPFILREIAVVRPKVIVVLGATAAHNLLQVKTPISRLRGSFHDYFGVKVMPTFHPAYLLRDPHKKREVWEDMKMVRSLLNSPVQP